MNKTRDFKSSLGKNISMFLVASELLYHVRLSVTCNCLSLKIKYDLRKCVWVANCQTWTVMISFVYQLDKALVPSSVMKH